MKKVLIFFKENWMLIIAAAIMVFLVVFTFGRW